MTNSKFIKICGLRDSNNLVAASAAGASHVGFVFFDKSPRNISLEACAKLIEDLPAEVARVALVVDPGDDFLDALLEVVSPDILQFHGRETPERLEHVMARYPYPQYWKALGISSPEDLGQAPLYNVDMLLFDAKPPVQNDRSKARPGGHGQVFDWSVLTNYKGDTPWLLAGGLNPDNISGAIKMVGPLKGFAGVDVSSGVESAPGQKDPHLITHFIERACEAMSKE